MSITSATARAVGLAGRPLLALTMIVTAGLAATHALADTVTANPGVVLSESRSAIAATCSSDGATGPCRSINLFGAKTPMSPGSSHRSTVVLRASGSQDIGTLMLVADECTQQAPSQNTRRPFGLCRAFTLSIVLRTPGEPSRTLLEPAPLRNLDDTSITLPAPTSSGEEVFEFVLTLDRNVSDVDIGGQVAQSLSWMAAA